MADLPRRDVDPCQRAVARAVHGLVADGRDWSWILLAVRAGRMRADVDAPPDGTVAVRGRDDDVLVVRLVRQPVGLGKPEGLPRQIVEVRVRLERGDDRPVEREQGEGEERQEPQPRGDVRSQPAPELHMFSRRRNWSMAKTITAMMGNMKREIDAPFPR